MPGGFFGLEREWGCWVSWSWSVSEGDQVLLLGAHGKLGSERKEDGGVLPTEAEGHRIAHCAQGLHSLWVTHSWDEQRCSGTLRGQTWRRGCRCGRWEGYVRGRTARTKDSSGSEL